MKILMYAPIFPPTIGGPSTQAYSLCGSLHKHGEKVVVVTIGEHFERNNPDGYSVYRYPWKYTGTPIDKVIRWIVFPFYFKRILKKEKPDIVHCHSVSILSFVAGWISKLKAIPTIIKFAGDWVWETLSTSEVKAKDFDDLYQKSLLTRLMWKFERVGLSLFDYIWAPSEFRAKNVEKIQGHRRNVRVIYNALDLPPGGYHEMKEDHPFTIITANRFIPHKRLPMLVKVFARLKDPSMRLVLIGSGSDEEASKVLQVVKSLNLENQVTLTGRIESSDIYERFSKASVYISTSLEEGFPNVFVEAMHFGLPIISTNVGGCHEIVQEGVTGYLYDPMDEALLGNLLMRLRTDIKLRNKMAKAAYNESHQYELSVVLKQFLALYNTTLNP